MDIKLMDYGTVFFCDETKFSINDGDSENSIFYFGVAMPPEKITQIHKQFFALLSKHKVQAPIYHSTKIFNKKRVREALMFDIVDIIISNKLHIFCVKYEKNILFESTKLLNYLNDNDIIRFNSSEFQALFYFLILLNSELNESNIYNLRPEYLMFFDRNVYGFGKKDEFFRFPRPEFIINEMAFTEKSKIGLLALADFVGYIFRKSGIHKESVDENEIINGPELEKYSFLNFLRIDQAGLFHYYNAGKDIGKIQKALEDFIGKL